MKLLGFLLRIKLFKLIPIIALTIPINIALGEAFNPIPKMGKGFLKCDDGRFAVIPNHPHFFVSIIPQFYGDVLDPISDVEKKSNKNIKDSISSVTSYIYPYKSLSLDENWQIAPFVNVEGAIDDSYSLDWYSKAQKNDWFTADRFFRIYNLPTNEKTYKFTLFESNKIKNEPYSSNEKGQLKSQHTIIDLSHQNKEGKNLSMIILTKGPQKGDFYIKVDNGKIYEAYSKGLGNDFANIYKYPTGYTPKVLESIMCPDDLNKEIIIRNVFHLGIGITNLVGETKTKYVGLQVIETKLKTKKNSSTEKEFNEGFPSF